MDVSESVDETFSKFDVRTIGKGEVRGRTFGVITAGDSRNELFRVDIGVVVVIVRFVESGCVAG